MNKCSCGNLKDEKYFMCVDCHNKKVEFDRVNNWLNLLKNFWIQKNVESIINLFSSDCVCYDTPFSLNCNVKEDW